jgi:hypothetical protein
MRVPILYLRSTKGAAGDYAFDPDWDIARRCGEKPIAEDSLSRTIAEAVRRKPAGAVHVERRDLGRRGLRHPGMGHQRQARAEQGQLPVERER